VDIARMSPIDALNLLNRLQEIVLQEGGRTKASS
jgi:hypothetical protein